ncbi:unnamed protein product [Pneumocystis jirovecii]|uniref:RRM domain-containing protein n=1 Tax=Pneumocystis jirovecii TaxID=42068 RepID=L0PCA9_PNEJI|nr:unnamed protein product [Pneumocystis jirovecii]
MSLEKSLDDIINDRKISRNSRTSDWILRRRFFKNARLAPYYKSINFYKRNYNEPWTHDLYEGLAEKPVGRISKQLYRPPSKGLSYRVKIENLHYELTEDDLNGLFKKIGPVTKLSIKYDRSGRSTGTAYVNFERIEDAHNAINQFNGANAAGQPITLTLDLQPPHKPQKGTGSLFSRISNFKVKPLYRRRSFSTQKLYKKEKGKYKTQEDLDNELDKYMNVAIQSKDVEKPMVIDQK